MDMNKNAIQVRHSSIHVPNYTLGDNPALEKMLSVWNEAYFRLDPKGYDYNEETKLLRIPRGIEVNFLERTLNRPLEYIYEADPADKISIKLKTEPRDDIQRKSISFLSGLGKYDYTKRYSQMTLNLDTGDGKTYCAIAALSFLGMKTIIITHNDLIKKQWHSSIKDMTNLDERLIFNIDGSSTIKKMMKLKTLPYKIYQVNHRTLFSYAKKHGWEAVGELFKHIRVGVKIIDEAHLEFGTLLRTDFYTNTKKTIYLTATFQRSHHKENKLFDTCFRNIARYGRETRKEKLRHILYVPTFFNSRPGLTDRATIKGPRGLDKNKYIDYQVDKQVIFDVVLWLAEKFKEQQGKILILVSKIDAVDEMHKYVENAFPEKTCAPYHSKIEPADKEKALDADIIVSTPKSLGTGNDVPNLRFVIMTEPYSSAITAEQTAGRLRKLQEHEFCFFIELVDKGFPDVMRLYRKRLPIFKKKCNKILELNHDSL